jgi:hypothetical protein
VAFGDAAYAIPIVQGENPALQSGTFTGIGPYGAFLPGTAQTVPTPAGVVTGALTDYGGEMWNVKSFGAIGDGSSHPLSTRYGTLAAAQAVYSFATSLAQEIDYCAIQAAINIALSTNARAVYIPIGRYIVSNPLLISPAGSATADVNVPMMIGGAQPAAIGDVIQASACEIVAGATFPIGEFTIDYVCQGATHAICGGGIVNLELPCASRSAGTRILDPRRFYCAHVNIRNTAAPAPANNAGAPLGAWNVVMHGSNPEVAYNYYEDICVAYAGEDSFFHNCADAGTYVTTFSLNPVRYNYNISGLVNFFSPHYEKGTYAWVVGGASSYCQIYGGHDFGLPTAGWCTLYGQGSLEAFPIVFNGCIIRQDAATANALITIQALNSVNAIFNNCYIEANTATTNYVYAVAGAAGHVLLNSCIFAGTVTGVKVNDVNNIVRISNSPTFNPQAVTTPAVSTPLTNTFSGDVYVSFIANAAGTTFTVNGKALGATPANAQSGFYWPAGTVISYVNAPASWAFIGL